MAEPTPYELQRAQRVERNRRKMQEMGLLAASQEFAAAAAAVPAGLTLAAGTAVQPRIKRRREQTAEPAAQEPTRLSRRLRGETAPSLDEVAAAARAEAEAEGRARARAGGTRKQLRLEPGQQLVAPFSLWSIGVTIWELGQVHRGAWAHRYWSSPGCLYHHAYPVGYRATKVQFGRTYEMRIEEGPTGPLFKVTDQQTGTVFSGASPTKPWTDVCIAHRTGQRISGPLFFGFSDSLTQRAIAANLYNQEELRAALQGEKLEGRSDSPEEQAAREFSTVEGLGEATAIVLARSTALGGSRHGGLESLKSWAAGSDANAQALFRYLTNSEELPESTRRWPAWRQRLVPKVVLALSGRWLGSEPAPSAGEAAAPAAAAAAAGPEILAAESAVPAAESAAAMGAAVEALPAGAAEVAGAAARTAGQAPAGSAGEAAEEGGDSGAGPEEGVVVAQGDCGSGAGAGGPAPPADPNLQLQRQRQQAEPQASQAAAALPAGPEAAAVAAAALSKGTAKENRQPQSSRAGKGPAAGVALGAPPPAGGQQQRSSRRERKANSKFAGFLTAAPEGAEAAEWAGEDAWE